MVAERDLTIWCLLGLKAGDNTQVRALADELGYGYEEKHIVARPWELLSHLLPGISLAGIDVTASSALAAPWPDLVITAGRRNELVARWIQQQSGGRTRLVHIGRPWAPLDAWDLIVTTPQYFLPQQENILHNSLPLHRVGESDHQAAGAALRPRLNGLQRPWIAVLAGGDSGRFVMTPDKGRRLGKLAQDLAAANGGTLLVTDSARTPVSAGDELQSQLTAPHFCYRWQSGADNPYRGMLALADAFVVTGESMSMLGEAVESGKPVFIFDLGDEGAPWWLLPHNYRYKSLSYHLATALGPRRMRRDIGRIQDELVASGRARWLTPGLVTEATGEIKELLSAPEENREGTARDELARTADAVRQLVIPR